MAGHHVRTGNAMVMDRSTLGHNLKPLERDDLVLLRLSNLDRRKRYVELTRRPIDAAKIRRLCARRKTFREDIRQGGRGGAPGVLLNIAGNKELNQIPIRRPA